MPTYTELKGVSEIGTPLLTDELETNLLWFFQWGLLGVGGFFNVQIPSTGAYGGQRHRLQMLADPNYTNGQVWQGYRSDWVWETGVPYATQPISVSGVYVNGDFYSSSTTGAYAHHIDYPRGQVVFDSPISTSSVVTCEYSHRLYSWSTADVPWWRKLQAGSFRADNSHFNQSGSGAWAMLSQNRIQLPAVIVEGVTRTKRHGKEIGGLTQVVQQDVRLHVLAETRWDLKQMHDLLTYQQEKAIIGFDKNLVSQSDAWPLDYQGSRVDNARMYPDLARPTGEGGFGYRTITIKEIRSFDSELIPPFFSTTVLATCEVDVP